MGKLQTRRDCFVDFFEADSSCWRRMSTWKRFRAPLQADCAAAQEARTSCAPARPSLWKMRAKIMDRTERNYGLCRRA